MAIPILFELNQELTRLAVAGSRLSAGDPRLKKFIAPLKKYGEKVPVFLKLSQYIEELLEADANQSAQKLIEAATFLLSILSTQGDVSLSADETLVDLPVAAEEDKLPETRIGYRTLSPVINALTQSGGGRMEIVRQAFEDGVFSDPRIYKAAVDALGDKYSEMAEFITYTVLPTMGAAICPFVLDGYNVKGGTSDGRRLAVMHTIKREEALAMVDEAMEIGSAAVRVEAVKIMAEYPSYEAVLLSRLDESKTVREEVMRSLIKLNSKAGIDKIIAIYAGKKADTALDAVTYGVGEYLTSELLKVANADYEAVKSNIHTADDTLFAAINKLKDDVDALSNKPADETVQFFKTMISEDYLVTADSLLPKAQQQGYYYRKLENIVVKALYDTGKGDDYLWDLFLSLQKDFLGNTKKNRLQELYTYAFYIGSRRLDAEAFYDTFFKTHLYKQVEGSAFQRTFLRDENCPPFSDKIASYFMVNMKNDHQHVRLVLQIVAPDDNVTLNLLAKHVRINLENNMRNYNTYDILVKLGQTKHKEFSDLYKLYCDKGYGSLEYRENLAQYL